MRLALILTAGLVIGAKAAAVAAPDSLVIMDLAELRAGALEPEFDFIAASATVFGAAIAQADSPAPSLASLLTSEYAAAHGVLGPSQSLSTSTLSLAGVLARAGFKTAAFSASKPPAGGLSLGFEAWMDAGSLPKAAETARRWLARHTGERFFLFIRAGGAADAGPLRDLWRDLERGGLLPRTVVLLVAENGSGGRGVLSDGALRVPFVIWDPRGRPRRVERVVSAFDAAPTAVSLLGLRPPPDFEGVDRSAFVLSTAPAAQAEGWAFSASASAGPSPEIAVYSVRGADWKLIYEKASGNFHLVEPAKDAGETTDASESEPGLALELTQKLLRHIRETRSGPERARAVSPEVLRELREKGYW